MNKTTLYLPEDLKHAVEAAARLSGTSEAEVIRGALRRTLTPQRPRPHGGLFTGTEPIADRVDELLAGFGES
jgi:hypothetical protein